MILIYLAGPLFTLAEKEFNLNLVNAIKKITKERYTFIVPQIEAAKIIEEYGFDGDKIFQSCIDGVDSADIVLAVLDGSDSDSGTCGEVGYAYKKSYIIGVRTDLRDSGDDNGLNLMLSHFCDKLIVDKYATIDVLASNIVNTLDEYAYSRTE